MAAAARADRLAGRRAPPNELRGIRGQASHHERIQREAVHLKLEAVEEAGVAEEQPLLAVASDVAFATANAERDPLYECDAPGPQWRRGPQPSAIASMMAPGPRRAVASNRRTQKRSQEHLLWAPEASA